jgi:hypothetical protein
MSESGASLLTSMSPLQGTVTIVLPRHSEAYSCSLPALVLAAPLDQARFARWN